MEPPKAQRSKEAGPSGTGDRSGCDLEESGRKSAVLRRCGLLRDFETADLKFKTVFSGKNCSCLRLGFPPALCSPKGSFIPWSDGRSRFSQHLTPLWPES